MYKRQDHIRQPVRFAASIRQLEQQGINTFLEIGPQPILLGMGRQCIQVDSGLWLPSLRPPDNVKSQKTLTKTEDWQQILTSLATLYLRGVNPDWNRFYQNSAAVRVSLPTYPFQRQRYWLEPPQNSSGISSAIQVFSASQNPLLGQQLSFPGTKEIRFQGQISSNSPQWLGDHQVFDTTMMPGTGYLEMALEAATAIAKVVKPRNDASQKEMFTEAAAYQLTDIHFHQALVVPENGEQKITQFLFSPESKGLYTFKIFSLESSAKDNPVAPDWILHATGKLQKVEKSLPKTSVNLKQLQDECPKTIPIEVLYRQFEERQIQYGSSFRVVKRGWYASQTALGEIV